MTIPTCCHAVSSFPWAVVDRKAFGFRLSEIQELLDLRIASEAACGNVELTATRSIERIEEQMRGLRVMKEALGMLVAECRSGESNGDCPIIQALDEVED